MTRRMVLWEETPSLFSLPTVVTLPLKIFLQTSFPLKLSDMERSYSIFLWQFTSVMPFCSFVRNTLSLAWSPFAEVINTEIMELRISFNILFYFRFTTALHVPSEVVGATWMAISTSAPELFTNVIGTFLTNGDMGVGTIVGSAVFNVCG